MLSNWQRIEQVIKWTGCASVSAFAREIGLNRSENLYQIKRGNNGISKELAEVIVLKYPKISKAWLLTGEGDMLPTEKKERNSDIPFYKTDAQMVLRFGEQDPSYHISFPLFVGSDFAAFTFSGAMEPEIPRGSVLFFQLTEPSRLTPGEIYLIVTPEFNGIRKVRKDTGVDILRLVPANLMDYDEISIDINQIEKLYLVRGIVINKSL